MDELLNNAVFDTLDFEVEQRFHAWRDSVGVIFDAELDDNSDPMLFQGRVEAALFGELMLGCSSSTTQAFERGHAKIRGDGLDHYLVQVFVEGWCEVGEGPQSRNVRPGDIYIMDASAPLFGVDYDFKSITVFIPRDLISQNLTNPDAHHLRIIPKEAPLAKLLHGYICALNNGRKSMTEREALACVDPLLKLTEGALNTSQPQQVLDPDGSTVALATTRVVKEFIESNLDDRQLRPEQIAAALGLSRSRLYRLFEPMGGVAAYVRQRRLRRSLRTLLDRRAGAKLIGEIAYGHGFGSESDYSRAFKRHYGCTPGEARNARMISAAANSSDESDHSYERWIRHLAK